MMPRPREHQAFSICFFMSIILIGANSDHCSWRMSTGSPTNANTPNVEKPDVDHQQDPLIRTDSEQREVDLRLSVMIGGGVLYDDDGNPIVIVSASPEGKEISRLTANGWVSRKFSKEGDLVTDEEADATKELSFPMRVTSEIRRNNKAIYYVVESDTDFDGVFETRSEIDVGKNIFNEWRMDIESGVWHKTNGPKPLFIHGGEPQLILRECSPVESYKCEEREPVDPVKWRESVRATYKGFSVSISTPPYDGRVVLPRESFREIKAKSEKGMPALLVSRDECEEHEIDMIAAVYSKISLTAGDCLANLNVDKSDRFEAKLGGRDVMVYCPAVKSEVVNGAVLNAFAHPWHRSVFLSEFAFSLNFDEFAETFFHELLHVAGDKHECTDGGLKNQLQEGAFADSTYACGRFCSRLPLVNKNLRFKPWAHYEMESVRNIGSRHCGQSSWNHAGSDDQAWDCARCAEGVKKISCGNRLTPFDRLSKAECGPNIKCVNDDGVGYSPFECLEYAQSTCDGQRDINLVDGSLMDGVDQCVNRCSAGQPVVAGVSMECAMAYAFAGNMFSVANGYCEDPDQCPLHRVTLDRLSHGLKPKGGAVCQK